jgi:hypothetical protein
VNNNPVNATDPTGHQCVGEPEECLEDDGTTGPGFPGGGGSPGAGNCSGSGCQGDDDDHDPDSTDGGAGCDTNGNGIPDIPCPGLTTRDWNDGFNRLGSPDICPVTSLIECYYLHASLNMGQTPMNIDLNDFQALMLAIYYEVNGRESGDLIVSSMSFDTPFYDHGVFGGGALPGTACIDGLGCFARHELNYVAQGEISAAAGESPFAGQFRVQEWKLVFGLGSKASPGAITMWNIGYVFYNSQ